MSLLSLMGVLHANYLGWWLDEPRGQNIGEGLELPRAPQGHKAGAYSNSIERTHMASAVQIAEWRARGVQNIFRGGGGATVKEKVKLKWGSQYIDNFGST